MKADSQKRIAVTSELFSGYKNYWLEEFKDGIEKIGFPYDSLSVYDKVIEYKREGIVHFTISKETMELLNNIGKDSETKILILLTSSVYLLLHKYTDAEELTIGMPIFKQAVSGNFINTFLPVKLKIDDNQTIKDFILDVRKKFIDSTDNQNYPIDLLIEQLGLNPEGEDGFPLFDIALVFNNLHDPDYIRHLNYSIEFHFEYSQDELKGSIYFNKNMFHVETIEKLVHYYQYILCSSLLDLKKTIKNLTLIGEVERNEVLSRFNPIQKFEYSEHTIEQLLNEKASAHQDKVAIVYNNEYLTFGMLNQITDKLALNLKRLVKNEEVIGIYMGRSTEFIISIFAIIKAGAAYLPINVDDPQNRIEKILLSSGCEIVIYDEKHDLELNDNKIKKIAFGDLQKTKNDDFEYKSQNKPSDLAYVIFTSGSTGVPKGVMIEHRNLISLVDALKKDVFYFTGQNANVGLVASYVFDASIQQIFGALLNGHSIFITSDEERQQGDLLINFINRYCINILDGAPSHLQILNASKDINKLCSSLQQLVIGGDILHKKVLQDSFFNIKNKDLKITNVYGIAECCVDSTSIDFTRDTINGFSRIPVGKPIENSGVTILNKNLQIQPVGVWGNIYISGNGIGRGYIGNKELTNERFIFHVNFFNRTLYNSGDIGRWTKEGNIEILGRSDNQIKIRGVRIELEEIEKTIKNVLQIDRAIVVSKSENKTETIIIAYIEGNKHMSETEVKDKLSSYLPYYMIPSFIVFLDQFPVNSSGKISKKDLVIPKRRHTESIVAPISSVQKELVKIWAEVLGMEEQNISINANFFDLGGHSLRATIFISMVHKKFEVKVPLIEIFKHPTIEEIAAIIEKSKINRYDSIKPAEKREYYKLSSAQKRIFFMQQLDLKSVAYNTPYFINIKGDFDIDKFRAALNTLVKRHECLRTSFTIIDNEPVQIVNDNIVPDIEVIETDSLRDISKLEKEWTRPFDLALPSLFRVKVMKYEDNGFLLYFDLHHIITDGTSGKILDNDFKQIIQEKPLNKLNLRYIDFALWQNSEKQRALLEAQKNYWIELLSQEIPLINLPYDYPRPLIYTFQGATVGFYVEEENLYELKKIAYESEATLYIVLLSVFNILLSKVTGQEDIIVGSPVATRLHSDLQNIVGMFVNTLAMRNSPRGYLSFWEFLNNVKENTLKAFKNQEYQFEDLVDQLSIPRDVGRNPIFDVMLNLYNHREYNQSPNLGNGKDANSSSNSTAKFDLNLTAIEYNDKLGLEIEYCTSLFKKETIEFLIKGYNLVLRQVIDNVNVKISDITLLDEKKKKFLINDLNNTYHDYNRDATLVDLYKKQMKIAPHGIAVVCDDMHITYDEIDNKSNQVVHYIKSLEKSNNHLIIGVLMDSSIHSLISILGILKAGSAFLPLDPSFPVDKLKIIVADSRIELVIVQKKYLTSANKLQWESDCLKTIMCIDSLNILAEKETIVNSMMDEEVWNYISETSSDEITGGGWFNSFTGQPFSTEEMNEYTENAISKINCHLKSDTSLLEIGMGSGLSLPHIVPNVKEYYGTDISSKIIETNKTKIVEKKYTNVRLSCLAAHEIDKISNVKFDIIFLNSVVQYFHGYNYFRLVLEKAIALLNDKGIIFIGDIMDLNKKTEMVSELVDFKKSNQDELTRTKIDFSKELFVSRDFFSDIRHEFMEIEDIDVTDKDYTIENELTKYRYDVLITVDKTKKRHSLDKPKVKMQNDLRDLLSFSKSELSCQLNSSDLAYIMYTSGTTGVPKGVMIEHGSVVNFIEGITSKIEFTRQDTLISMTNLTFDISILEIILTLVKGTKVIILPKEKQFNIQSTMNEIIRQQPSLLQITPSRLDLFNNEFLEKLQSIKNLLIGGEVLPSSLLDRLKDVMYCKIYNMYGPTETTIWSSFKDVTYSNKITLGKPISNTQMYITDNLDNLQPINISGELLIGGEGLARGYLNNPELTEMRFQNCSYNGKNRVYKTGDIAKWNHDGEIEFEGRRDEQVKIRGHRIELEEIRHYLIKHGSIKDALIIAKDEDSTKKLIAYIVTEDGKNIDGLREFLASFLPDYGIPGEYVPLTGFPLNNSGKIDKKTLLSSRSKNTLANYVAPENEIEEKLALIWSEVLNIDKSKISTTANFFELGGHSIKLIIVNNQINAIYGIEIPVSKMFIYSTISKLAAYIISQEENININSRVDKLVEGKKNLRQRSRHNFINN